MRYDRRELFRFWGVRAPVIYFLAKKIQDFNIQKKYEKLGLLNLPCY
jgi:hypothetical protein